MSDWREWCGFKIDIDETGKFTVPAEVRGNGQAWATVSEARADIDRHIKAMERRGGAGKKKVALSVMTEKGVVLEWRSLSRNNGQPELYDSQGKKLKGDRYCEHPDLYPNVGRVPSLIRRHAELRAETDRIEAMLKPLQIDIPRYQSASQYATVDAHDELLGKYVEKYQKAAKKAQGDK